MTSHRAGAALVATLAALVTLSVAAPSSRAAAAPAGAPSERERARAKLAEGAKAFDAGEYVQALRAFQEAYAIIPSPKIHFNFGLTYVALGRYADALGAFERFVAQAADASPENLGEAREQIASLRRSVAFVEVTCDVPGAQVVVSGRSIGTTPLSGAFPVDPGSHDLVVRKEGVTPHVREFTASPGSRQSFRVTLTPPPAVASTRPEPPPSLAAAPSPRPSRPWQTPAAWAAGIGGGALIAGGVVLEVLATRQYAAFNAMTTCGRGEPMAGGPRCREVLEDADRKRTLGIGALVAGGTAALASIVLAVWSHNLADADTTRTQTSATCLPLPGGLSCALTF